MKYEFEMREANPWRGLFWLVVAVGLVFLYMRAH